MADREARDVDVAVGRNVREAREEAGLTQREVVEQLRVLGWSLDVTAMTRIENGTRSLRVPQLQMLAEVLGTSAADLVEDKASMLSRWRTEVHRSLRTARSELVHGLTHASNVNQTSIGDPNALQESGLKNLGDRNYLEHLVDNVQRWTASSDAPRCPLVRTWGEDADALTRVAEALISDLFGFVDEEGYPADPERPPTDLSILG